MSLFLDIGQGAGLAGATGVRPFLPPLLAGAMARGDVGIDFDGTDWSFLESPGFLLAVFVLALASYVAERSGPNREASASRSHAGSAPASERRAGNGARAAATPDGAPEQPGTPRAPVEIAVGIAGLVLAALLFAGSLAAGGNEGWIGLVLGPLCAALAWLAVGGLLERARRRLDADAAGLLRLYADAAALLLAAIAILVPPLSFLALAGFVFLLAGGRRRADGKYAGLRVLR